MTISSQEPRSETKFNFHELQNVLRRWPDSAAALEGVSEIGDYAYSRICQVLYEAYQAGGEPSHPDLAPLLRQVLLSRRYAQNLSSLWVARRDAWPTRRAWESFGFECTEKANGFVISPRPWSPEWLVGELSSTEDAFADCYSEDQVRRDAAVPMPPFLAEITGYESFVCPGQREAVLSLLFMPEGSSLIINLPTGGGKTLVAQVPVLKDGLDKGLTLVVVPTTALAIDQSRRMAELLGRRIPKPRIPALAWHGELSDHERQRIKTNIRQGTQGILFASPEAVTGALLPALYSASEAGFLKYLFIDEAHLVAQWGDSFRPAFQAISGIRQGLLRKCNGPPFRTVLMSATFSPENLETLKVLFGPPDQIQMVSAVHLRPEPRYLAHKAADEEEKTRRILELVRFVPHPFILYVTQRKDATRLTELLRSELGYKAIACFTGETPNHRRESIIDQWANNKLNGVVATSAFGVGMDKVDVRSVIHATVPESLDRFYQEVGRAGRDGRPCISISVYCQEDVSVAKRISTPALIGDEKAYERWLAMSNAAERIEGEDLISLNLKVLPPRLPRETDYNISWNVRTLILMTRARLIQLDSMPPQKLDRHADEDEASFEARIEGHWDDFYSKIQVRVLKPLLHKEEYFQSEVRREQARGAQAADRSLKTLVRVLDGEEELGDALVELYETRMPSQSVTVSKVCRGCPAEPNESEGATVDYQIPIGKGIERIEPCDVSAWTTEFPNVPTGTVVFYPPDVQTITGLLEHVLVALVAHYGVREVSARKMLWRQDMTLRSLHRNVPDNVLVARDLEEDVHAGTMIPLPRVTLLFPWDQSPIPECIDLLHLDRPLHIILAPEDIEGAYTHKRRRETDLAAMKIDEFLKRAIA